MNRSKYRSGSSCWRVYKERQGQRLQTQQLCPLFCTDPEANFSLSGSVSHPCWDSLWFWHTRFLHLVFPRPLNLWQRQHEWSGLVGLCYILCLWETTVWINKQLVLLIRLYSRWETRLSVSAAPCCTPSRFHLCSGIQQQLSSYSAMIAVAPLKQLKIRYDFSSNQLFKIK